VLGVSFSALSLLAKLSSNTKETKKVKMKQGHQLSSQLERVK
jgi:hypothetical protein